LSSVLKKFYAKVRNKYQLTRDNTIYFIENFSAYTYPIQTIYKQYTNNIGRANGKRRIAEV